MTSVLSLLRRHSTAPPSYDDHLHRTGSTTSAETPAASTALALPPPPRRGSAATPTTPGNGSSGNSDELSLPLRDAVFVHQLRQPAPQHPLSITPATIIAARVCLAPKDAAIVHRALLKAGVLTDETMDHPASGGGQGQGQGKVQVHLPDTARITAALPRQTKVLYRPDVRQLVRLLFFWEEEAARWRAKDAEQRELDRIAAGLREKAAGLRAEEEERARQSSAGTDEDRVEEQQRRQELTEEREAAEKLAREVEFRAQAVGLRKRVRPSQRTVVDQLPKYE